MIKFYGTDLCPDCVEAKEYLKNLGLEYEFIDITSDISKLKEFLTFRDTRAEFKKYKEQGFVCVPALLMEDGNFIVEEDVFNLEK
ncbi:MAG: glutaredoxin [Fusobacterium sp.]|nr:glutaredoxin [Fusobacterium sp.]